MRARVMLGAIVVAAAFGPVILAATPAAASGCTAAVSDPTPQQNEAVTITVVGPASTSATIVAHFQATNLSQTITTDANGHGAVGLNIGGAAYGESVVVDITAGTASCSVSFTPTATGTSASSTSTTSATSTTSGASTTSTTAALTAATTPVTTAGATAATAQAAPTLPFTGTGADSAAVGVAAVVLVAAGHATRRRFLSRRS